MKVYSTAADSLTDHNARLLQRFAYDAAVYVGVYGGNARTLHRADHMTI